MPYTLPTVNVSCDVWQPYDPVVSNHATPDIPGFMVNLTPGRRIMQNNSGHTNVNGWFIYEMEILYLLGTYLRAEDPSYAGDLIEIPSASRIFYHVRYVDAMGLGFANEHRFAQLNMRWDQTVFSDVTFNFAGRP